MVVRLCLRLKDSTVFTPIMSITPAFLSLCRRVDVITDDAWRMPFQMCERYRGGCLPTQTAPVNVASRTA
jgi:hypothetical protein